jgi:dTDP-glucose 4,6-dehydratase
MKILISGGSGFIGSHFVDYILTNTDWDIVLIERLNYSGDLGRIAELDSYQKEPKRVTVVYHDLRGVLHESIAKRIGEPDYIVHFASSTHVDRAIVDPLPFYYDNVIGTANLVEFAKKLSNLKLFVNFSTDEVFGAAEVGVYHKEGSPFNPSNDYSAAKAGQEMVAKAAFATHKLPIINTHTMNNYGERQHPEKFLPKTVKSVLNGGEMPIYATVDTVSGEVKEVGSRVWMYAGNTADAIYFLLQHATPGEDYNIIGPDEYDIITLANKVAEIVGKPLIPRYVGFYGARKGHDRRYALDGSKLRAMGWTSPTNFDESLRKTVEFTVNNSQWM